MDILEKIKRMQAERGWTMAQFAEKSGITPSTLSMLFKRNNQPTISTLQGICDAFGVTIAQFFAEGQTPPDLTPEQALLLERWSALTDEQKAALFVLMNAAANR